MNKNIKATLLLVSMAVGFSSCSNDDISAINIPEDNYEVSPIPVAYTVNSDNKASNVSIEFRTNYNLELHVNLTKSSDQQVDAEFYLNPKVLERYNEMKGTRYLEYPEELVEFENEGKVEITAGQTSSTPSTLAIKTSDKNDPNTTYVIPISTRSSSTNIKVDKNADYLVFVKDFTKLPDAAKASGIQIISCMEVNDTNPLNNLNFTLKESGKPLIDVVILFSGNINYNAETGKVFNHNNPNVQHILDNREKYLKPLQDRGMKVVLGILGNHDIAGVNNLDDNTSREFAQELKAVCDAYHLDGIFWDDEYSLRPDGTPGFKSGGASRLIYETKQAMPDKLNCAYAYGSTGYLSAVDGVQPGDYIDWAIDDYGRYANGSYAGIKNKQWSVASQEFSQGRFASTNTLKQLRNDGYGGNMIFAMDPYRPNISRQISAMKNIAKVLFDDELVVDENYHAKDW